MARASGRCSSLRKALKRRSVAALLTVQAVILIILSAPNSDDRPDCCCAATACNTLTEYVHMFCATLEWNVVCCTTSEDMGTESMGSPSQLYSSSRL